MLLVLSAAAGAAGLGKGSVYRCGLSKMDTDQAIFFRIYPPFCVSTTPSWETIQSPPGCDGTNRKTRAFVDSETIQGPAINESPFIKHFIAMTAMTERGGRLTRNNQADLQHAYHENFHCK